LTVADREFDRALAALLGLAVGDAMGMPSQTMARSQIAETYGYIDDFRDASLTQTVGAGLSAGTITDDTEQSILLARHIVSRTGGFDEHAWADELLAWERDTIARGVDDLLGPSTKRSIAALQAGERPDHTGRRGTTNGAAMRIVPVAISTPAAPIDLLIDRVEETCRLTHNTSEAIGAASAVAAVVSAGIEGAAFSEALEPAISAARLGAQRGEQQVGVSIIDAIEGALEKSRGQSGFDRAVDIAQVVGTSVVATESVPLAFAIVELANSDPWQAAILSANIGDDTDTIGAIACAMCAACQGTAAIPASAKGRIAEVNGLEFESVVRELLSIRRTRCGATPAMEHTS